MYKKATFEKRRELMLTRQGKIIRGKLTTTEIAKPGKEGEGREAGGRDGRRRREGSGGTGGGGRRRMGMCNTSMRNWKIASSPKRVTCEIKLNEKLDRMSPFTVSVQKDTYPNKAT